MDSIDSFFGSNGKFRDEISEMGYYYFADVRSSTCIWPTMPQMRPTKRKDKDGNTLKGWPVTEPISVKDFVMQDNSMWIETILGEGSKGPNRSHIKLFRVYENNNGLPGREVWLFVRRFSGGKLKFSFSNAPEDFTIEGLDKMAITRWTIEQGFKECKNELGMDHYEVRSYRGWHRHMLLVMVAHEFLCQVQNMFKKKQDLSSTDELASDPSCRIINEDASIPDNVKSIKEEIRPIENVIDLTKKAFGKGKQDLEVPHSVDENTVSPRDVSNKYANKAESSKIPNQEVNTCGVLHLSNYEIDKIREITIDTDLPIITLPMAKMLAASAFSEDMKNICRTINKIDFYLHRNWKAYKSHRKRKMLQIESRTPL